MRRQFLISRVHLRHLSAALPSSPESIAANAPRTSSSPHTFSLPTPRAPENPPCSRPTPSSQLPTSRVAQIRSSVASVACNRAQAASSEAEFAAPPPASPAAFEPDADVVPAAAFAPAAAPFDVSRRARPQAVLGNHRLRRVALSLSFFAAAAARAASATEGCASCVCAKPQGAVAIAIPAAINAANPNFDQIPSDPSR